MRLPLPTLLALLLASAAPWARPQVGQNELSDSDRLIPSRHLRDPGFEGQVPSAQPQGAWHATGTGHRVHPLGPAQDNGFPSRGQRWLEISAEGTNGATPPSNPGGPTTPGIGGAGIDQLFTYPPGYSVLVFEAAFLRAEDANQPNLNDWMSVDIGDGSTTYNVFYADTFTPTPLTSAHSGLSMTAMETVRVDLATLFPSSFAGDTRLLVSVQVGNGRDGQQSSVGYVDSFRFEATPPRADFQITPETGLAPLTVSFEDVSSGNVQVRSWDFGDGRTSNETDPIHTYDVPGTYSVTLTVAGAGGTDVETKAGAVTVNGIPPDADFQATPTSGAAPLNVQFTDTSTGTILIWQWTFGDGTASTLRNPSHTYTATGTYTVTLTTSGPAGADSETKVGFITVATLPPVAAFQASPTSGIAPLAVNFLDQSSGAITSYDWDFGDGNTSTQASPSHVYGQPGSYTVSLTVSGPGGSDTETQAGLIQVGSPAPVSDFTGSPTSGTAPHTVSFQSLASGPITSLSWDFGDGQGGAGSAPVHTYTQAGVYTVSLTATGPGGADTETKVGFITVATPPTVAAFQASPTSGIAPLTVNFLDLSSGAITSHAWDFGDGNTSAQASPSHVYSQPGNYTVSLTVSGPGGSDTETQPGLIQVGFPPPVSDFTGTPTSGTAPHTVSFQSLASGTISSLSWDFGDGQGGTGSTPDHTYTQAGVYTVSLTASGPGGADTETKTGFVSVTNAPPQAEFDGSPRAGTIPLDVQFQDLSTGTITSRTWTFGDGSSSTEAHPLHTYSSQGTFSVTLMVTGPAGSDSETKSGFVVVDGPIPTARFSGTPQVGTSPLTVAFSDDSGGNITNWFWTFGDGDTSTAQNPNHTYTDVGSYTVSLTVSGPQGTDTLNRPGFITVDDSPPEAAFTAMPTSGTAPLTVGFSDLSSGPITNWSWNFGDGNTALVRHPIHTYEEPGTYAVSLSVSGPGGIDSLNQPGFIVVGDPPPVANFAGTPTAGLLPLTVNFFDTSTGNVSGWSWDFGDGQSSTLQSPTHVYTSVGSFPVSLTVTGPGGGNTLTRPGFVTVGANTPIAAFDATPTKGVAPFTVQFQDDSIGNPSSWLWDFGDGSGSTLADPAHEYAVPGTYDVTLAVTAAGGNDSLTRAGLIVVAEEAGSATVYGCGVNPPGSMQIVTGLPTVGGTLVLGLDNPVGSQNSGSIPILALSLQANANFPCGTLLANSGMDGPGELLISLGAANRLRPNLRGAPWQGPGQPALVSVRIPDDCSLIGQEVFAQGMLFDPSQSVSGTRFGLTDAVQMKIGP